MTAPERPVVDVVDGYSGAVVSNAYIDRGTGGEPRQATVELTKDQAERAVGKLKALDSDYAKLLITDDKEKDAELTVKFPKVSADLLSGSKIKMEIASAQAHLVVPAASFQDVERELLFRIEPVQEADRSSTEREATTSPLVRQAAKGGAVEIAGRPVTIGSNLAEGGYEVILPLNHAPTDVDALKNVAVFAADEDGATALVEGSIVFLEGENRPGIQFAVSGGKTGTFTVIRWTYPEHKAFMFGYGDRTFGPDRSITRAEIAAMLARVIEREEADRGGDFHDIAETYWAKDAIGRVSRMALMNGYPDGSFKPGAAITRAEMAAILARLLPEETAGGAAFADTAGSWAKEAIGKAAAAGIVHGYGDGTFRPDSTLTRAEAVTMIVRLLKRGPLDGAPQQWTDVTPAHWAYGYIQEASMDHSYEKQQDGTEEFIPKS
jgi:S-layer homology domain.